MHIRSEKQEDRSRIATLIARTYQAEGVNVIDQTGRLRALPEYSPNLGLVGEENGEVACYALFTPLKLDGKLGKIALLAPLAMDNTAENLDVTSFLENAYKKVTEAGYSHVCLYGSPGQYKEAGFQKASDMGLEDPFNRKAGAVLLVRPLEGRGTLAGKLEIPEFLR